MVTGNRGAEELTMTPPQEDLLHVKGRQVLYR